MTEQTTETAPRMTESMEGSAFRHGIKNRRANIHEDSWQAFRDAEYGLAYRRGWIVEDTRIAKESKR